MNDLEKTDPKQELIQQSQERKEIAKQKNRAIVPALTKIADEVDRRAKSGKLAKELKGLKVSSLLGNLTRIITAIKENAPQIQINNGGGDQYDPLWFRSNSAANMSESERKKLRDKVMEAEVVKENPK